MSAGELLAGLGQRLAALAAEAPALEKLFPAFSGELTRRGLPIWRAQLGLEVLHPEESGWMLVWHDERLATRERKRSEVLGQEIYTNSPTWVVDTTDRPFRKSLEDGPQGMELLEELRRQGATDYVMFPLPFLDKQRTAVASFATRRAGGFSAEEIAALHLAADLFGPYAERQVLRRMTVDLLDTYIGRRSGRRITDGQIELGQIDYIEAAIWLTDLRGFTRYSEQAPIAEVIGSLNAWLGPMVKVIEQHGGEVLKFIGDAVLASFRIGDDPARNSQAAFAAAHDALAELARMNAPDAELKAGVALHYGEASYGNIGSGHRLDFTVIGPDVNLTSRIQGICGTTGHPLLMSRRFAELLPQVEATSVGAHDLKGFAERIELFAPKDTALMTGP